MKCGSHANGIFRNGISDLILKADKQPAVSVPGTDKRRKPSAWWKMLLRTYCAGTLIPFMISSLQHLERNFCCSQLASPWYLLLLTKANIFTFFFLVAYQNMNTIVDAKYLWFLAQCPVGMEHLRNCSPVHNCSVDICSKPDLSLRLTGSIFQPLVFCVFLCNYFFYYFRQKGQKETKIFRNFPLFSDLNDQTWP